MLLRRSIKSLSPLVLGLFMSAAASAAPGDPGCEFDFDGDGFVTEQDLAYCQGLIAIFPPLYDLRCDTDGSGDLSTVDFFPILMAIQSGVDCRRLVPSSSLPSRGLLVLLLGLASGLALRFGPPGPPDRVDVG